MTSLIANPVVRANIAPASSVLEMLDSVAANLCRNKFGKRLLALVLTGSSARGEASLLRGDDGWRVLGDAEFLLVLDRANSRDAGRAKELSQEIESELSRKQLQCSVTLSTVDKDYLRRLPPHIFGFELRTCGRVVCGEEQVLQLIPYFLPSSIPLEDGWRILCNRLLEQFDCADEFFAPRHDGSLNYRIVKLYLDMGTSLLLFLGRYKPTYVERARELSQLSPALADKVPIETLAEKVRAATYLKLHPEDVAARLEFFERYSWVESIRDAERLWRWELERMLQNPEFLENQELLKRWSSRQPDLQRMRGWAYVARACGPARSVGSALRWLGLAKWGSPRHLIYSAGCELLFALADAGKEPGSQFASLCRSLGRRLPTRSSNGGESWKQLASEILENYRDFVEATRA